MPIKHRIQIGKGSPMTRFLVVFLSEGQFLTETVVANSIMEALTRFITGPMQHDEVYSITVAK